MNRPGDSGGIIAGFFAFTEITEPSAHKAYNEWHQFDHLPEQLPIAGIASGQRWVASPRCGALTYSSGEGLERQADLSVAQYLTLYLMRGPLDETLRCFYDLAAQLHTEDRFFPHRRALESGPLGVRALFAAPRVRVSPPAVPYRPNRGVYLVVSRSLSDEPESHTGVDSHLADELLGIDGVAGVWFFGPGPDSQEENVAQGRSVAALGGPGSAFRADVTLCFLDEDPVSVASDIAGLLRPRWEREGAMPRLAGPFETVVPWSWDWFDDSAST